MRARKCTCIILLAGFLSACTGQPEDKREVMLPGGDSWTLMQPEELGVFLSATQKLSAEFNGKQSVFIMQLEVDRDRVSLAVLNPTLVSIFSMQDTGSDIFVETSPLVPKQLQPKYILADIQLVYWPIDKLRLALQGTGTILSEEQYTDSRVRSLKDRAGNELINIRYLDAEGSSVAVELTHLAWNYLYRIENIEWEMH